MSKEPKKKMLEAVASELYKDLKAIIKANDEYDGDILNEIEDAREVLAKAEGRSAK